MIKNAFIGFLPRIFCFLCCIKFIEFAVFYRKQNLIHAFSFFIIFANEHLWHYVSSNAHLKRENQRQERIDKYCSKEISSGLSNSFTFAFAKMFLALEESLTNEVRLFRMVFLLWRKIPLRRE